MATEAENAGAAVTAAVEGAQENAQTQIARAAEDVNAANRQAEEIARAAIATDLGARIDTTRQEFNTWQSATEQRLAQMQETNQRLEAQSQETTTLLGSIRALLTPAPPPSPPAPGNNQGAVQTGGNLTATGPNGAQEQPGAHQEQMPEAPKRRRSFL